MYTPTDIDRAINKLHQIRRQVEQKQPTLFWQQCVRDIDGKWHKYTHIHSMERTKYFFGSQPTIDYTNATAVNLLLANISVRQALYDTLREGGIEDAVSFRQWLIDLRSMMEYRPTEEWKLSVHATTTHTDIVLQDVIPIAKLYDDPYSPQSASAGPVFDNIPREALPIDVRDGGCITHTYPSLDYCDYYFEAALRQLNKLQTIANDQKSYIHSVAHLYQLLVNLHYFPSINTSLYMNIANGLLELVGLQGVEHGIKDFVAMRLQPSNYQQYFHDEVMQGMLNRTEHNYL